MMWHFCPFELTALLSVPLLWHWMRCRPRAPWRMVLKVVLGGLAVWMLLGLVVLALWGEVLIVEAL